MTTKEGGVAQVDGRSNETPTVESRRRIGFPSGKAEWCEATASYTAHNLWIAGHPVMQDWEDGYMATLAEIVGRVGGRTLEVGYGLGLSARYLTKMDSVEEHWIIECHPDVIARAVTDLRHELSTGRVHLLGGFWEDVVESLDDEQFDGILFDTYPLTEEEVHANHYPFFSEAHRLLKNGGVFTYYSDEATELSESHLARLRAAGFVDIDWITVPVSPPESCEYWQDQSLVAPIVKK
jgi:guanidinoacetate N-methyltransferase